MKSVSVDLAFTHQLDADISRNQIVVHRDVARLPRGEGKAVVLHVSSLGRSDDEVNLHCTNSVTMVCTLVSSVRCDSVIMVCTNAASIAGNAMKVVLVDAASRLTHNIPAVVIDAEAVCVIV